MSNQKPTLRLRDLIGGRSGAPGSLLEAARRHDELARRCRNVLAAPVSDHIVSVIPGSGGRVTILVDSPVWASRIRFLTPALADALASSVPGIVPDRIRIRVHRTPPGETTGRRPGPSETRTLSTASRSLIRATADHIDNPDLARALRRLAGGD